jgi:hypothetical protein
MVSGPARNTPARTTWQPLLRVPIRTARCAVPLRGGRHESQARPRVRPSAASTWPSRKSEV